MTTVARYRAPVAVVVGCALLLARPLLHGATLPLVTVLVAVGVAGLLVRDGTADRLAFPLAVGAAAILLARLAGGHRALPFTAFVVATNTLAAVAEEAFFRRLLYGVLQRWGTPVAVVGSAAAFALVHVTTYGVAVLPVDLAAGLLLSWQRAAAGTWRVPALTHVLANLVAVI